MCQVTTSESRPNTIGWCPTLRWTSASSTCALSISATRKVSRAIVTVSLIVTPVFLDDGLRETLALIFTFSCTVKFAILPNWFCLFYDIFELSFLIDDVGSCRDHHAAVGKGRIGVESFRRIVNDRRLENIPIVLETPSSAHKDEIELLYGFME